MRVVRDRVQLAVPGTATGLSLWPRNLVVPLGISDRAAINAVAGPARTFLHDHATDDPSDEKHPVVVALRATLDQFGSPQVGVQLHLRASIPRSRGLGSHSADTLLGILAAHQLVDCPVDAATVAQLGQALGAEPLRMLSALQETALLLPAGPGAGDVSQSLPLVVPNGVSLTAFVPNFLPGSPPDLSDRPTLEECGAEAARAALFGLLFSGSELAESDPDLLLRATEDPFGLAAHEASVPSSVALIRWLREQGLPAALSGSGPAVLCLLPVPEDIGKAAEQSGWQVLDVNSKESSNFRAVTSAQ